MAAKRKQQKYAIIDIETTGGMPRRDKIIEIAIVIHDGNAVIDQFSSLVHPERSIPYEITRITGIDDSMVEDAPKFYHIAKQIVEYTEDTVFVAHNVNFDYSFIREEFERLGFTFTRKQLCTVKMSRKAFPGLKSYALGNLIRHFDIEVNARHRALDDALATAIIFDKIIKGEGDPKAIITHGIKATKLPEAITMDRLQNLPETTGVYYFYDQYGTVVYVGKSINIKSRILQHFGQITAKSEKLMRLAHDIDFVTTGSELIALLLESEEIKTRKPQINRAQRNTLYQYYIYTLKQDDVIVLGINKVGAKGKVAEEVLCYHATMHGARSNLSYIIDMYCLCEKYIIIPNAKNTSCLMYNVGKCYGLCQGIEESTAYNERALEAVIHLTRVFDKDMIIVVNGRNDEELGLVLIENKMYRGYGYIMAQDANMGIEEMRECIEIRYTSPEANMIIMQYLKEHKPLKIISI